MGHARAQGAQRHLARSYGFLESLERFLLDKAKGARPTDPPMGTEGLMFPSPGTVFDPDAIAVLCAAYEKAIRGQAGSLHETIAKRIIELASEGERDLNKLCHGALALSIRRRRSLA